MAYGKAGDRDLLSKVKVTQQGILSPGIRVASSYEELWKGEVSLFVKEYRSCYGLNFVLLTPSTSECDLFGNKITADGTS